MGPVRTVVIGGSLEGQRYATSYKLERIDSYVLRLGSVN